MFRPVHAAVLLLVIMAVTMVVPCHAAEKKEPPPPRKGLVGMVKPANAIKPASRIVAKSSDAILQSPVYLPNECYDSNGRTQPCLMVWHAGDSGQPSNSLWAALNSKGVGHAALWIGQVDKDPSNIKDKNNYVSWWPKGGTSGVGKNDVYSEAVLHSYEEDLGPNGEGKPPHEVLALVGWSSENLRTYFEQYIQPGGTYVVLGRNCVCITYDLIVHGVDSDDKHAPSAMEALKKLAGPLNHQTPKAMHEFVEKFTTLHDAKECAVCKDAGCRVPLAERKRMTQSLPDIPLPGAVNKEEKEEKEPPRKAEKEEKEPSRKDKSMKPWK